MNGYGEGGGEGSDRGFEKQPDEKPGEGVKKDDGHTGEAIGDGRDFGFRVSFHGGNERVGSPGGDGIGIPINEGVEGEEKFEEAGEDGGGSPEDFVCRR